MKNLLKAGIVAFAFGIMFVSVDMANAQNRGNRREARREYRDEIRDARRDYRQDIRRGENRLKPGAIIVKTGATRDAIIAVTPVAR